MVLLQKSRGFLFGLLSVIFASVIAFSPILGVMIGLIFESPAFDLPIFQALFVLSPPLAFLFALIGKRKSTPLTTARKLCNIGAGVGLFMLFIFLWTFLGIFWESAFSVPPFPATITALVDAVILIVYLLGAYLSNRFLWFL